MAKEDVRENNDFDEEVKNTYQGSAFGVGSEQYKGCRGQDLLARLDAAAPDVSLCHLGAETQAYNLITTLHVRESYIGNPYQFGNLCNGRNSPKIRTNP